MNCLPTKKCLFFFSILFFAANAQAQLLSWTPQFPTDTAASQSFVITMDASKGNQGLLNYSPTTDVYVHIGVITSLSTSPSDWKYAPFQWGTTPSQGQCNYIGNNKWTYTINGSLRTFFGISNSTEIIRKIAILFRSGDGSRAQRNTDGSDMYIPVYDNSVVAARFTVPPFQPTYIPLPEPISKSSGDNITLTALANKTSTMSLFLNGSLIQTTPNTTTITANPAITTTGNQAVIVTANDGVSVSADTLQFYASAGVVIAPLPGGVRDGINYESDNTAVTLVLYAPYKKRVSVIGEFPGSNWVEQTQYQMNKSPDGNYWWLRITGLTPGTEYAFQYLVDGSLKIADPYTEKVLDPYNDATIPASTYPNLKPYPTGKTTGIVSIVQTGQSAYNWQVPNFNRPDKRNIIVYELLVRDFVANHDWNTLRDTLNYLKNLGVNAIEIMPFNEFEGNLSWGYNPDFYFAPDKYYGPAGTLKVFIDSCHKKGMAVIMDIALNHSFGLSPMVQLYWDTARSRPAANNPWFNPVPKHPYNVGYDMNHESLATRYFVSRIMEHWLQNYKIDGFRFDLSKGFTQKQTCDSNGNNCDVNAWSAYDSSRIAIWKRYYDTLQLKSSGCYAILEHFAVNTEETELSNYGMMLWGNMSYNYEQASMGYNTDWNFQGGIFTNRGWTNPYLVTYMESHDEERMMYKNLQFGNSAGSYNIKDLNTALKRIEMCGAFLFTIPGPKMFWEFGEMGYDFPINYCQDGTINPNCRTDPKPIRWDYLQNIQRLRLHDIFSALIKLRFHPLYKDGFTSNRISWDLSGSVKYFKITTDTSNLLVVGNFDVTPQNSTITFQNAGTWYDYLNATTITATGSAQAISLQPGEYHVYLNRNVVNAVVTAVGNVTPTSDVLSAQVYPNPVSGSSVINLQTTESGKVIADLYNMQGQKIGNVYSGFLVKGQHTLPFNQPANKLSAGSYILTVRINGKSVPVKIILPH
ncbi:MAG: T9SS type A sorting domain-containing protein [Chitinophagaceae bacterium]|nr:T9SS type A sorting domain-containing protein [Chitinophagaceae bacterium]